MPSRIVSSGYVLGVGAHAIHRENGAIVREAPTDPLKICKYDPPKHPDVGKLGNLGHCPVLSVEADLPLSNGVRFNARGRNQAVWRQLIDGPSPKTDPYIRLTYWLNVGGSVTGSGNKNASGIGAAGGLIFRVFTDVNASAPVVLTRAGLQFVGLPALAQGVAPPELEFSYRAEWGDNWVTIKWDSEHSHWVITKRLRLSNGNWEATQPIEETVGGLNLGTKNFAAYTDTGGSVYTLALAQLGEHEDPREENPSWTDSAHLYDYLALGQTGVDNLGGDMFSGHVLVTPILSCVNE